MRFGSFSLVSLCILVIGFTFTSCASTSKLSPTGVRNYHALELVRALGVMQDAAIDGQNAGVIKPADTKKVVLFVQASVKAEKAQQSGWLDGINSSLNSLETDLGPSTSTFNLYITAVRTALAALANGSN